MSHGRIPWYTGAKFFKKVLEKFRKEEVRSSGSYHSPVQGRQKKKSGTPHQHALVYTGAKFFYLQEARKIYSTLHTRANFSIFVGGKLEKFKESSKWASWRSKSQKLLKWASWRSKSQKLPKWASWKSKSQKLRKWALRKSKSQ